MTEKEMIVTPTRETSVLDLPYGTIPDPDEFIRAAMRWHFDEETGSPFWLGRAKALGFDPVSDVTSFDDLRLFPNVTDELRGVPVRDLIPRGFGPNPDVVAVIESGGTTGSPKRVPFLRPFADLLAQAFAGLCEGRDPAKGWLVAMPSGPHIAFEQSRRPAHLLGAIVFGIDFDPRWVKKAIGSGNADQAEAYVQHLVDQAALVLRDEDIGTLRLTPPLLARFTERDELVDLINEKVDAIDWGGAQMDRDSRHFYRSELFPNITLRGYYGTTMALGAGGAERTGLAPTDPCIFDPYLSPYVSLSVVDVESRESVPYGSVGQLVVNHVSKSFFLPNNAERDLVTRIEPASEQIGDSFADVHPLQEFGGTAVIEGVY